MPEGRRWSPENPSPAMKSFAAYIREQGYDDSADLETTVAATFVFHRDWQSGHAKELVNERAEAKAQREAAQAEKAKEREAKKAEREQAKAEKEAEKERKRAEREAAKAEKEAAAADGDDSTSASSENGEPAKTRKRLRTKGDVEVPEAEPVTVGVSEASF